MTTEQPSGPDAPTPDQAGAQKPAPEKAEAAATFDENAEPVLRTTHFDFANKVFKVPKARIFKPDNLDEPVMVVDLGDMEGQLKLRHLRKQFNIVPDSHDDKMLEMVVKALNFVEDIRAGDKIPNEILDGSSSWTVSPRHKTIARNRLEVQLIGLISEQTMTFKNGEELAMFLNLPESKAKLREAFKKAAVALGLKEDETEPVLLKLELLTREFCFIEALREAFNPVPAIMVKLKKAGEVFQGDMRISDTVERVKSLMRKGVNEYQTLFAELDEQTSDIVTAMRNLDIQISQIREKRDKLRYLQMKWTPLVRAWAEITLGRGAQVQDLMGKTYRFLATRFDTSKSLMKVRKEQEEAARAQLVKEREENEQKQKERLAKILPKKN